MQDAKFQDHRTFWFWRRGFLKVFTIYGHGGHFGHVTWSIYINFRSPFPRRLHIKFCFNWSSVFRECLKLWMTTDDDDGRRSMGIL